jgi:hypothetical protein
VSAFRIDPASGALTAHGSAIALPTRPIHITTDIPSAHVLVAFNNPSALRVYRINGDATLGGEVKPSGSIDFGIYGHQVRVTPNNRLAILVTRGNDATNRMPEDPGSLKVFNYKDLCLQDGGRWAQAGAAIQEGHTGEPRQHPLEVGRRHRARAPERPCPLRCEPRGYHQGVRGPEG